MYNGSIIFSCAPKVVSDDLIFDIRVEFLGNKKVEAIFERGICRGFDFIRKPCKFGESSESDNNVRYCTTNTYEVVSLGLDSEEKKELTYHAILYNILWFRNLSPKLMKKFFFPECDFMEKAMVHYKIPEKFVMKQEEIMAHFM